MPCSKTDLSLSLCWPINQKYLAVINICKVDNSHKFANFFHAVKYALTNFTFCCSPFAVEPIQNFVLKAPLTHGKPLTSEREKSQVNLYVHKGKPDVVFKLFDTLTISYAKLNGNIIKDILHEDYLPCIKEINLTNGGHYKCSTYNYILARNPSEEISLNDFKSIMGTLDTLHSKGYMHSDELFRNVVFCENSNESKLIDFDLMDKVDVPYPFYYNDELQGSEGCHCDAKGGRPRKIVHDRYSLVEVILDKVKGIEESKKKRLCYLGDNEEPCLMKFFAQLILLFI